MSTETMSTIEQKQFNAFLQLAKPITFTCFTAEGLIFISNGDHTLMIGEHDGVNVSIKCDDGKKLAKYVRSAKAGATIETKLEDNKLVLSCDALGEMSFDGKEWAFPKPPMEELGEYVSEIDAETVKAIAPLTSRCDDDDTRYRLAGMYFQATTAVATDGRRMVVHEVPVVSQDETFLVPSGIVKMAAKLGEELIFNQDRCVVGQSIHRYMDGRYPDWQQVMFTPDTGIELDGDAMRKQCKQAIEKAKIEDQCRDDYVTDVELLDGMKVRLDPNYLLEAIGKMKSVRLEWDNSEGAFNKHGQLVRPVMLTSDEMPAWTEIIMPKHRD